MTSCQSGSGLCKCYTGILEALTIYKHKAKMSHPKRKHIFYMTFLNVWFSSHFTLLLFIFDINPFKYLDPWSLPLVRALVPNRQPSKCVLCALFVFLKKIDILHAGVLLTSEMFSIQSNIYIFIGIMALVEEMAQLVEGLPWKHASLSQIIWTSIDTECGGTCLWFLTQDSLASQSSLLELQVVR